MVRAGWAQLGEWGRLDRALCHPAHSGTPAFVEMHYRHTEDTVLGGRGSLHWVEMLLLLIGIGMSIWGVLDSPLDIQSQGHDQMGSADRPLGERQLGSHIGTGNKCQRLLNLPSTRLPCPIHVSAASVDLQDIIFPDEIKKKSNFMSPIS